MIYKTLVCIVGIALGLYAAWWSSAAAHFVYVEKVKSFDDLSTVMFWYFVVTAAIFCPACCWGLLKVLQRMRKKS